MHSGYTFSQSALLLALASAKRIGDLHAFSVDSDCIHFGPGDCGVTFWPRITCLKSLSTPFRTQTVSLSALVFWVVDLTWCERSIRCASSGLWGFTSTVRPAFGNLTQLFCMLRVVVRRPYQKRLPLDCGRYQGCLYEAKVWNAPFILGLLSKGYRLLCALVERYVYSGYMLCRRLVFSEYLCQVFTSWTVSPWPPKCCRWVTDSRLCYLYSCVFAASHSNYSVQPFMLLLLLSALYSVQLQLYNVYSIGVPSCFVFTAA